MPFAVLGTGEPRYEVMWRGLAERQPDRVGAKIGFDEPSQSSSRLARIFVPDAVAIRALRAQSDAASPRHGTLPIVRRGGRAGRHG